MPLKLFLENCKDYNLQTNKVTHTQPRQRQMLSVIMPVYNAAATLGEQLEALKAQNYEGNWEIVAVNNRSTDSSVNIIQAYQGQMPHLRLVDAIEKQGRAYACNVGAREAKGDAFIFCDADDVVAPSWLAAMAEGLAQSEFAAGTIEVEALNQTKPWCPQPPNWATKRNLDFLPFAGGALMAVSRQAFEQVGGFNEDAPFCEDIDLSWRLQLQGFTLYPVPEAIVHVRYRETVQAMWKQNVRFAEAHVYLYKCFTAYGMPRSSIDVALCKYNQLVKSIPTLLWGQQKQQAHLVRTAAVCWGRLRGSLRYRTIYL